MSSGVDWKLLAPTQPRSCKRTKAASRKASLDQGTKARVETQAPDTAPSQPGPRNRREAASVRPETRVGRATGTAEGRVKGAGEHRGTGGDPEPLNWEGAGLLPEDGNPGPGWQRHRERDGEEAP